MRGLLAVHWPLEAALAQPKRCLSPQISIKAHPGGVPIPPPLPWARHFFAGPESRRSLSFHLKHIRTYTFACLPPAPQPLPHPPPTRRHTPLPASAADERTAHHSGNHRTISTCSSRSSQSFPQSPPTWPCERACPIPPFASLHSPISSSSRTISPNNTLLSSPAPPSPGPNLELEIAHSSVDCVRPMHECTSSHLTTILRHPRLASMIAVRMHIMSATALSAPHVRRNRTLRAALRSQQNASRPACFKFA
ncbi:hypothetical protein C8Q74DRAFT_630 [Fomes fomentarius]|nr:hypothetical protein C8Q74DRAFT_630 [Fomes fomentarius]